MFGILRQSIICSSRRPITSAVYIFDSVGSDSFTLNTTANADILVIGGGGSTGYDQYANGGGGGAGGYRYFTNYSLTAGTYNVTVGAGASPNESQGESSSFDTISASGGGFGGSYDGLSRSGQDGGSGGGGRGGFDDHPPGAGNIGGYTPVEGYAGETRVNDESGEVIPGGGGGSAELGGTIEPGAGGAGTLNNITGQDVYYAGGGCGGDSSFAASTGVTPVDADGAANTGSGAGASSDGNYTAGYHGGSGIVVVRIYSQTFNALSFDGVDDRVIVADDPAFEQQTPTLEFWAYHNNQSRTNDGGVGKGEVFGDERQVSYIIDFNNGGAGAKISDGSFLPFGFRVSDSIDAQTWTHWALTYDGSTLKLYKNGNIIDTLNISITIQNLSGDFSQFVIGGRSFDTNTDRIMDGSIAEVRVWNYARSQSEIINNANSTLIGNETGLVAYYPLDQGSGTTATDKAGTNDGTIYDGLDGGSPNPGATWITRGAFPDITTTYSGAVLTGDPVAYWRLDETSGTTAIDQTGNHDGTYNGSPTLNQSPLITEGTSVQFDGTDDYIEAPSSTDFDLILPFSVAFWMNTTINDPCLLVDRGGNGVFSIQISSNPTGAIICNLNGEIGVAKTSALFNDGSIYFIVITFKSGANSTIHVNGQQVSLSEQQSGGQPSYGSSPVRIGRRDDGFGPYDGNLDEVAIYDHALTETQIQDLYNIGTQPVDPPTIGLTTWYTMDNIIGSTLIDEQGNADASITGAVQQSGVFGQSLHFDGIDNKVESNAGHSGDTSFSFWAKYPSSANVGMFISQESPGFETSSDFRGVFAGVDDKIHFVTRASDANYTFFSTPQTYAGSGFVHVVFVQKGSVMKGYVNNTLINTIDAGSLFAFADDLNLAFSQGTSNTEGNFLDGNLDQVRIYNRAITRDEVTALYNEV